MKGRSVVFVHLQQPFTVFGCPPLLIGCSVVAGMAVNVVCMVAGIQGVSVVVMVLTMAGGMVWGVILGRRDKHVESVLMQTGAFWRGGKTSRVLLAGLPAAGQAGTASRSRGGRR